LHTKTEKYLCELILIFNVKKILKEVITIVVGKQAEGIVDLLISEKYVNEFLIAKKMELTINQIRNILYKISDHGLVSSTRKKDKKKGWYTYSWKIEIFKSLLFLRKNMIKKKSQIDNQINSRETRQFYVCERCNIEVNEENAMAHNFTCNECGDIFILKNNEKFLRDLRRNLSKLNRELELIDEEIEKQKIKADKKKMSELNKQEKIKLYDGRIFSKGARGLIKSLCEEILESYAKKNIIEEIFDKVKRKTKVTEEEFNKLIDILKRFYPCKE